VTPKRLQIIALPGIPEVEPGDDLARIIATALAAEGEALASGDIIVMAQKIVSKAEGRTVDLDTVMPSARALSLATEVDKDPRLVDVILSESAEVLRARTGLLIVVHRLGFVLANAGVDASNVAAGDGRDRVLLLPEDPDGTCAKLRAAFKETFGLDAGVIICDSIGRAWRSGTVGIALGAAGLPSVVDLRGRPDRSGRPLKVTWVGLADGIAAAASLVMGEADEGTPVALVRGYAAFAQSSGADALIRPKAQDLFR
jgi:coenzyme F420-0:L-glutamate ligase/coenzyme F420-1:gamma-L-glutamate ligase